MKPAIGITSDRELSRSTESTHAAGISTDEQATPSCFIENGPSLRVVYEPVLGCLDQVNARPSPVLKVASSPWRYTARVDDAESAGARVRHSQ